MIDRLEPNIRRTGLAGMYGDACKVQCRNVAHMMLLRHAANNNKKNNTAPGNTIDRIGPDIRSSAQQMYGAGPNVGPGTAVNHLATRRLCLACNAWDWLLFAAEFGTYLGCWRAEPQRAPGHATAPRVARVCRPLCATSIGPRFKSLHSFVSFFEKRIGLALHYGQSSERGLSPWELPCNRFLVLE
jgi:hypothetical protein